MLHLTEESYAQYGLSNLCGYQFVNQDILYSLFLLYTVICDQYVMQNVVNSLL
jgi:hypothetical protein